ncbi:hypothetical protein NBRC116494_30210 [Aurantivibrio plasticivorans]
MLSLRNLSLIAVLVVVAIGLVFLTQPYNAIHFERSSNEPVTLSAKFLNATDDPLCTNIYVGDEATGFSGVLPRFPSDLPDLHSTDSVEFGESVELTGFQYEWVKRNKITGAEVRKPTGRMDVLAWSTERIGEQRTKLEGLKPSDFNGENYTSCR